HLEPTVLFGQIPPGAVELGEAEITVQRVDGGVDGVENALAEITLGDEFFLELFLGADIAFAGDVAKEFAVAVVDGRDGRFDWVGAAVAPNIGEFADPIGARPN